MQRTPPGETHVVSRSAGQINWSAIVIADSSCCRLESVPWETWQELAIDRQRKSWRREREKRRERERKKYTMIVQR